MKYNYIQRGNAAAVLGSVGGLAALGEGEVFCFIHCPLNYNYQIKNHMKGTRWFSVIIIII